MHGPILHQSITQSVTAKTGLSADEVKGLQYTFAAPPLYETERTPYGMRQASLRAAGDEQIYIRIATTSFPSSSSYPMAFRDRPTSSPSPP